MMMSFSFTFSVSPRWPGVFFYTPITYSTFVAIKRQLGTLKRYLKISTDDARRYQTMRVRAFRARQKDKANRIRRTRRRI